MEFAALEHRKSPIHLKCHSGEQSLPFGLLVYLLYLTLLKVKDVEVSFFQLLFHLSLSHDFTP